MFAKPNSEFYVRTLEIGLADSLTSDSISHSVFCGNGVWAYLAAVEESDLLDM